MSIEKLIEKTLIESQNDSRYTVEFKAAGKTVQTKNYLNSKDAHNAAGLWLDEGDVKDRRSVSIIRLK